MPLGFTRIKQGSVIRMGGRDWDVHMGNGHAPEHATFWSRDDNLVITGDQILSSISPNLGSMSPNRWPIRSPNGWRPVSGCKGWRGPIIWLWAGTSCPLPACRCG